MKRVQKAKENPDLYNGTHNTQLEYYTKKGFSRNESLKMLSDRQRTNTIEKMGEEKFNNRKNKFKVSISREKTLKKRRRIMEDKGLWIKKNEKTDWELYKNKVWYITNKQDLESLEFFNKRGPTGTKGSYHLDHVISIKYGFDNNIAEEVIGNINNLQMLQWKENLSKGTNCYSKIKGLK